MSERQHHVSGLGIDCRYCHSSVETSAFAGMPSTKTCMRCHSQIWSDSPLLAPVRELRQSGPSFSAYLEGDAIMLGPGHACEPRPHAGAVIEGHDLALEERVKLRHHAFVKERARFD